MKSNDNRDKRDAAAAEDPSGVAEIRLLEARLRLEAEDWREGPIVEIAARTVAAIRESEDGDGDQEFASGLIEGRRWSVRRAGRDLRGGWLGIAASVGLLLAGGSAWVVSGFLNGDSSSFSGTVARGVNEDGNAERRGVLRAVVFERLGEAWADAERFLVSTTAPSYESELADLRDELKAFEGSVRRRLPWVKLRGGGGGGDGGDETATQR